MCRTGWTICSASDEKSAYSQSSHTQMKKTKLNVLLFLAVVSSILLFCFYHAEAATKAKSRANEEMSQDLSTLRFGDIKSNSTIASAFKKWLEAINAGDESGAFLEKNAITAEMERIGTRNLVPLADVSIVAGKAAMSRAEIDIAFVAASNAVSFAPDYPKSHFTLAYTQFKKDKTAIGSIMVSASNGIKAILSDTIQLKLFASALAKYAYLAFLVSAMIVFVALALANGSAISAEIVSIIPADMAPSQRRILGALVLIIPFALGGWFVFLLATPVFLWPYLKNNGKSMAIIVVAVTIATPQIVEFMAKGKILVNADAYKALYLLSEGTWDHSTITALEEAEKKSPGDPTLTIALGLLNKLQGKIYAAIEIYDLALAKNPTDLRALVNKGNVYFLSRQFDKAAKLYKDAATAHPDSAEAHFNLSNTLFELYKTGESEAEYSKARAIDQKRTAELVENAEKGFEHKVVDYPISANDLKRFESALPEQLKANADAIWFNYFGGLSRNAHKIISLIFVALLIGSHFLWSRRIAHQACASCGASFKPPIALTNDTPKCNQCVAATLKKRGGVSSATQDKKLQEIRAYRSARSGTASMIDRLVPGAGRVFSNESVSGMLFSFSTAFFLVFGAMAILEELGGGSAISQEAIMRHIVFVGSAAFYWFLMNTAFLKEME